MIDKILTFTVQLFSFLSDLTQFLVASIALFVAWSQREKISDVFRSLLNYSHNIALSDLHHLITSLEDADLSSDEARINLAKIEGQIKGNQYLQTKLGSPILKRVTQMIIDLDDDNDVRETQKISLCHELRSQLMSLQVENHMDKKRKN